MPKRLDELDVEAIRLLTDAVRSERVPGIVEFGLLERALVDATETRLEETLVHAAYAFRALDGDFQRRVANKAEALAAAVADLRRSNRMTAAVSLVTDGPVQRPRPALDGASPFLAALNVRKHKRN